MSEIKILSEQLRNQIAAGEVVERPASVVKELVENSIDAGGSRIVVEIIAGGTELIRVTDDGKGMSREDAELALERHATSKISEEADLHNIGTMGFRGEALASIASVSQFRLRTKKKGEVEGTEVVCNGSNVESVEAVGCPEGTQIEVKNLFYNTPARKKYLKTLGTEYRQILEALNAVALAYPGVSFSLIKDGKIVYDVPAANGEAALLDRVRALLGKSVADEMIPVFYGGGDIQVTGLIGRPSIARSSRRAQSLFVNKRPVQNNSVAYMVRDAYGTLLMDGKKPMFVMMIEIHPKLVDVNVHPRKSEVRFVDQREVCRVVRRACKAALEVHVVAPKIERQGDVFGGDRFERVSSGEAGGELGGDVGGDVSTQEYRSAPEVGSGGFVGRPGPNITRFEPSGGSSSVSVEQNYMGQPDRVDVQGAMEFNENFSFGKKESLLAVDQRERAGLGSENLSMLPLAQVANSYIVAQNSDGLVLIDQHAAHERVLFEKFKDAWEKRPLAKQPMLVPMNIELSHQEIAVFEENKEVFESLGFEIDAFGGNTFAVGAVPSDASRVNVEKLLIGILDDLVNERKVKSAEERKIKILEYMACRTAIKFGDPLTMEEMKGLVKEMDATAGVLTCPHGRPTMIPLTFDDLEKKFGRRG